MKVLPNELALAERIAKRMAPKWSAVEREDLQSVLTLWLLERPHVLERYRKEPGGEGKLYVALYRAAQKYCVAEQEVSNGSPLGEDGYRLEEIANALPFIFDQSNMAVTETRINPNTGAPIGSTFESNTLLDLMVDLRSAFARLTKEQQDILAMRFRDGLSLAEVAEVYDITKMAAANRIARAIKSMQNKLNGQR